MSCHLEMEMEPASFDKSDEGPGIPESEQKVSISRQEAARVALPQRTQNDADTDPIQHREYEGNEHFLSTLEEIHSTKDRRKQGTKPLGSTATSLVDSAAMSQQQQPAGKDQNGPPVCNDDEDIISPLEGILKQNAEVTVRWTMTAVAALLAISAFLTVLVASNYRFLVACLWATLLVMFVGFAWFVQQTVFCAPGQSRRVFHPAVHAVADWVMKEVNAFVEDCRDEYTALKIANEAAYENYRESAGAASAQEPEERKPKSKLFRIMVKPLLNLTFRGRRKRRKEQTMHQQTKASSYVPPTETFPEAELV
jgi:hypothetical protein